MCKTRIQEEIEALMSLYHLGKAPLSYALGVKPQTLPIVKSNKTAN